MTCLLAYLLAHKGRVVYKVLLFEWYTPTLIALQ